MDLKKLLTSAANILASLVVVGGVFLAIGRPMAQDFIEGTVDERIGKIESQMLKMQLQQNASDVSTAVMRQQLESLLQSQREAGRDTDTILRLLQQLNN